MRPVSKTTSRRRLVEGKRRPSTTTRRTSTVKGTESTKSSRRINITSKSTDSCLVNCQDEHRLCKTWMMRGECRKTPDYMLQHCAKSCNSCCQRGEYSSLQFSKPIDDQDLDFQQINHKQPISMMEKLKQKVCKQMTTENHMGNKIDTRNNQKDTQNASATHLFLLEKIKSLHTKVKEMTLKSC